MVQAQGIYTLWSIPSPYHILNRLSVFSAQPLPHNNAFCFPLQFFNAATANKDLSFFLCGLVDTTQQLIRNATSLPV